ncbi:MAG: Aminodeoxychorismate lyase [Parcubacteria group bacterium GW2011_GWA1_56_13]|nr:MAG: Aminodeoxychorismate lyase [Parcubacteria group bacterium GW2011_GWA1_56_13]
MVGALALAFVLVIGYVFVLAPPRDFPSGDIISISQGASVPDIARQLSDALIVKHPEVLRFVLRISGAGSHVQAGAYFFRTPENALTVAYRLAVGAYDLPPARITFPEGTTVREMALRVAGALPLLPAEDFIRAGKPNEGYLFPDTYLFPPDTTIEKIVATMRENFDAKIRPLLPDIRASGHSLGSVVIMASLIEKEARTTEHRRLVAGVLWNRLALGMPLQVDAVFGYIFNRDTYSPSFADLTVDSPYNTYTHVGLPPGPINNPGLNALNAALHPTKTDYLYYLTDRNGVMHYAMTYAAHQANQAKYLR